MAVMIITPHKDFFSKDNRQGIGYILQDKKTQRKSFYGCHEENPIDDFKNLFNDRLNKRKDNITYYHIKQTFSPDENVNPDTAFEIGNLLAFDFAEKGHQVVLSTHTDTGKIHNHLIISSVSIDNLRVIKQDKKWFYGYKNLNDDILNRYNLLTCSDLKQRKNQRRKNEIGENKLLESGIVTDKIKIIDILNKHIYDDKINNIFSMIKQINLIEDYKCVLRGNTLTFTTPDGKKMRPSTISQEFSTDSIKKKLISTYTEENKIYDVVTDVCKNSKNEAELMNSFKKNNIDFIKTDNELIFNNNIYLRDIIGKPYSVLENEFKLIENMEYIKKDLKKIMRQSDIYSLDDFFAKAKESNLINNLSIHKNTLMVETELGNFDLYKISDSQFNYNNIKLNIFINSTKSKLDYSLKNGIHTNILDFLKDEKIQYEINPKNEKMYFLFDDKKINLNRLYKVNDGDTLYKELFIYLGSLKNEDDFFNNPDFIFDKTNDCYIFKSSIELKDISFRDLEITKDNILKICQHNILDDITKKSLTFVEFQSKYKENNLDINFNFNKVMQQINTNQTVRSFFKSLKNVYSLEEYAEKMSYNKHFNFNMFGEDIIYKDKDNDSFYKSSIEFMNKVFNENIIKRDLFLALKESNTIGEFKVNLKEKGHTVNIIDNAISINGINIEDFNFISKYGDNLFRYKEINERLNQNYDYINKTSISIKSQFTKIYFEAIKNSSSIDTFKIRLLDNDTFDFKFDGNTIYFKFKNTVDEDYINSEKYNSPNFNLFNLDKAEEIINENSLNNNKTCLIKLLRLFNNRNTTRQKNCDKDIAKHRYLRIKEEIENDKRKFNR